jgi:hypothetical protein
MDPNDLEHIQGQSDSITLICMFILGMLFIVSMLISENKIFK